MGAHQRLRSPQARVVELDDLRPSPGAHLATAWNAGAELVVAIRGEPWLAIETVEDLEVLGRFMDAS